MGYRMNKENPSNLFLPAAALIQSNSSSAALLGFFPLTAERPYLYINACFLVMAKYPYRHTQEGCDGYCFLYTENGQGSLTLGGKKDAPITLAQEQLFLWPCSQGFSLRTVSSHWNHYFLFLDGREAEYFYRLFSQKGAHPWPVPPSSRLPSLLSGLSRKDRDAYASPLQQVFLSTALLTEALTLCQSPGEEALCPDYLLAIRRMLDEEYSLPCSLDLLEKRFQVSKFRIAREFSQYFRESPIAYLTARRIQAAKDLLVSTPLQIQEISQNVGYSSPTLFIRSFKKAENITPQEYRRRYCRLNT